MRATVPHPSRPRAAALAPALVLALASAPPQLGAAQERTEDRFSAAVAAVARESLASGARELVVVVDVGGETLLSRGFGAEGRRPDGDTPIHAGPFLSSFLSVAALQLAEQGRLDLDASLDAHFPELPYGGLGVRVDQLLTHTSGIPSYGELLRDGRPSAAGVAPERVLAWLRRGALDARPASCASYSETDDLLLGLALERAAGSSVRAQLEALFARAGMEDSGPACAPRSRSARVEQEFAGFLEDRGGTPPPFEAAELCTTARDLVRFQRALVERRLLGERWLALRRTPATLSGGERVAWGRGLTLSGDGRSARETCGGALGGERSLLAYLPELEATVAAWGDERADVPRVVERVARALLAEDEPQALDLELPDAERERYVGDYYAGCISYAVTEDGARLVLHPPSGDALVLAHQGGDRFLALDDPYVRLEFERAGEAVVAFVIWSHGASERARRLY